MRACILLIALLATACAVSPSVTPYPIDAQPGAIDAPGPGPGEDASGPPPDALPIDAGDRDIDARPAPRAVGWPQRFQDTQIQLPAQTLFAFRLPPISDPVSLEAWGVIPDIVDTPTQVRMALYSDNAGTPDTLINWSEAWPAADREHPAGGAPLEPGVYWLVVIANASLDIGNDSSQAIAGCPKSFGFATPFDDAFGAVTSCTMFDSLNVYILVRDR